MKWKFGHTKYSDLLFILEKCGQLLNLLRYLLSLSSPLLPVHVSVFFVLLFLWCFFLFFISTTPKGRRIKVTGCISPLISVAAGLLRAGHWCWPRLTRRERRDCPVVTNNLRIYGLRHFRDRTLPGSTPPCACYSVSGTAQAVYVYYIKFGKKKDVTIL